MYEFLQMLNTYLLKNASEKNEYPVYFEAKNNNTE